MTDPDRRLAALVLVAVVVAVLSGGTTYAVLTDTETVTVEFSVEDADTGAPAGNDTDGSSGNETEAPPGNEGDGSPDADMTEAGNLAVDTRGHLLTRTRPRTRTRPAGVPSSDPATFL